MTPRDLSSVADRALDAARNAGAVDAVVDVRRRVSANVRFARNAITTSGSLDEITVSVWVGVGQRHAHTSTNQIDDASLRALAERAMTMAKLSPEDPERMPLLPPQAYPDPPSAFDDAVLSMPPEARAAVAARAAAAGDAAKVHVAGFFERDAIERVLRSSAGVSAAHRGTTVGYTTTARTTDGTGSGWAGGEAWRAADLDDAAVSKTAIEKARASAKPKALSPGKYTVILEPAAVANMLHFLVASMDQRSADEGRSYFTNKIGEKLFSEQVTLVSDPTSAATPDASFDDEGVPLSPQTWIEAGRAKTLAVSRYWAAKTRKPPTGNQSVVHLLGGTAASVADLVRTTKRGLLVTRFWYTRMLEPQTVMLTGLTRDGVFLVEDGRVTAPVQNFRYNESPVTVLKNVDVMTRETFRVPSSGGIVRVPALRTREFTMASVSAAV